MPKVYFYLPFNDETLVACAEKLKQGNVIGAVAIHGKKSAKDIKNLTNQLDVLYISAHGRFDSGSEIAGEVGARRKRISKMNAVTLAKALRRDGLSKEAGDIRLMVCWGGYAGGNVEGWTTGEKTPSRTLKRNVADAPFAGQLCSALKNLGYYRMIVTGYTGVTQGSSRDVFDHVRVTGQDGKLMQDYAEQDEVAGSFFAAAVDQKLTDYFKDTVLSRNTKARTVWY